MSKETLVLESGAQSKSAPLETLHILYYRHGNNPHTQSINFTFDDDFKQAIARGRTFCERMGWKFIKVEPFLTNLEDREKRSMGD